MRDSFAEERWNPDNRYNSAAYEKLLNRFMPGPSFLAQPSSFQPFFRILRFVRRANSELPAYSRKDYAGQFYWTEESFLRERQNGFSALTVLRDESSGPIPFLVGEKGIVVSGRRQERLFRFGRVLCNTLLKFGMAPDVWDEVDVYALEWFCLAIRVKYLEFRLCDDHWKAEAFAAINYAKWHRPQTVTIPLKEFESPNHRDSHQGALQHEQLLCPGRFPASSKSRERREVAIQVVSRLDTVDNNRIRVGPDYCRGDADIVIDSSPGTWSTLTAYHRSENGTQYNTMAQIETSSPSFSLLCHRLGVLYPSERRFVMPTARIHQVQCCH